MAGAEVPRTREELIALEARYRPLEPASAWADIPFDRARWDRHAAALRTAVGRAGEPAWQDVRERFLRAAALDSTALAELIRPAPDLTTFVLRSSLDAGEWTSIVEASRLVVECHRRALVVAADVASRDQPIDENLVARLQDLIVESQETYTVIVEDGEIREVELPKRQYKPVSNYLERTDHTIVPFAPAAAVAEEMRRLTIELSSDGFRQLHPAVQSGYSHGALIHIHPFADGNGRLARTMSAIPLLRATGLPPLILADQWPAYVEALERWNEGDRQAVVELFLEAQINAMDLARNVLAARSAGIRRSTPPPAESPERTLLDLATFHLRDALGVPPGDHRVAITRGGDDRQRVRLAIADAEGASLADLEFAADADDPDWLRLASSGGDVLELARRDVDPAPLEIAHLRVRAWLDRLLREGGTKLPESTPVRGLFVLGVPRSGTTMMGNWLGSHPAVLGLAEYGGFYIAHSVAPAYLTRLPGGEHAAFVAQLRRVAEEHAVGAAREQGRTWFCDATPWNLQIAAALAEQLPDAVFVLMLRHFAGCVLSLRQFHWAGETIADAAQLWVTLNACIEQLPADRTLVVGYDTLAARPSDTVAGVRSAIGSIGLAPGGLDDTQLAASHAHVVGKPRPTVAAVVDGRLVLQSIPSLDAQRWTPEVHAQAWPVVAQMHRSLLARFSGIYTSPPRPDHVPESEW